MKARTPNVRTAAAAAVHDRIARVERMLPGYRVIAGPYNIESSYYPAAQREKMACLKVKLEQLRAGVDCKVLLLKDGAWVLRDGKGWRNDNVTRSRTLMARGLSEGLLCPVCRLGPFLPKGLKVHRCPELPTLQVGGRVYHQRLSCEQIEQAMKEARA